MRGAALVLALGLAAATPAVGCDLPSGLGAMRADLLALTNSRRAAQGQGALRDEARLTAVAQAQACHTAGRQTLSHRGSWLAGLAVAWGARGIATPWPPRIWRRASQPRPR